MSITGGNPHFRISLLSLKMVSTAPFWGIGERKEDKQKEDGVEEGK